MAQDPLRSGWSPYSYVHNDPLTYVDPLGLSEDDPDYWAPELVVCAYSDCTDEPFSDLEGLTWRDAGGGAGAYVAYYYKVWLTYGEHGRRALQAYDGLDQTWETAEQIGEVLGEAGLLVAGGGVAGAALRSARLAGNLTLAQRFFSLKGVTNPWNHFQHLYAGTKYTPAAYQAWKGSVGYSLWKIKSATFMRYPAVAEFAANTVSGYNLSAPVSTSWAGRAGYGLGLWLGLTKR